MGQVSLLREFLRTHVLMRFSHVAVCIPGDEVRESSARSLPRSCMTGTKDNNPVSPTMTLESDSSSMRLPAGHKFQLVLKLSIMRSPAPVRVPFPYPSPPSGDIRTQHLVLGCLLEGRSRGESQTAVGRGERACWLSGRGCLGVEVMSGSRPV